MSHGQALYRYRTAIFGFVGLVPVVGLGYWTASRCLVSAFDTGLYLQWFYNFIANGSFSSSITGEQNFLAHHFQPISLLFSPLMLVQTHAFVLFCLSGFAVFCSYLMAHAGQDSLKFGYWQILSLAVCLHPTIAARAFYSFSPDILALPAFVWLGFQLEKPDKSRLLYWFLACLWVGGLKENFWLIGAIAAFAQGLKWRDRRFLLLMAANLLAFLLVFFWWMPSHSNLASYYGLRFYLGTEIAPLDLVSLCNALLANFWQTANVVFAVKLLVFFMVLPFVRWRWSLLPAGVACAFVVFSGSQQLRAQTNHYLIPIAGFIWPCLLLNYGDWRHRFSPAMARILPLLLTLAPFTALFFEPGGILDQWDRARRHPETQYYHRAVESFSHLVPDQASLIIDGNLQPLMSRHQNSTVLLSFTGNPKKLSPTEMLGEHYVLTSADILAIENCRGVEIGGASLEVDSDYFAELCQRIKFQSKVIYQDVNSGLVGYHLESQRRVLD